MPQNITDIEDYTGFTDLALANVETSFNEFAFEAEKEILRGDGVWDFGLLGDQVYIALLADLDSSNEPQTAPWTNLVDGVNYTAANGETVIYGGLRKMLTFFVYSQYVKDFGLVNFQAGTVKLDYENAVAAEVKRINHKAHKRWNKGVDMYNGEVYDYLLFNQTDFTNWNFTLQSKYLTKGII